jgi:hypothetical protein
VRVQGGKRNRRLLDAEVAQQPVDVDDRVDRVAQRQVAGEEEDPELADDEHRVDGVGVGAEQVRGPLGVAGEPKAAGLGRSLLIGPVTIPSTAPSRAARSSRAGRRTGWAPGC